MLSDFCVAVELPPIKPEAKPDASPVMPAVSGSAGTGMPAAMF